ncbi:hypothetical protein NEILACOT_03814 [Neisseria lactamica ATCC 23970]|uniref:Uncharacterized protein n=1 Tax=Neisseria lactamica ATCC 23970 TaxID=546265 RepID=D0W8G0_NEILA|nr:hypothetical protein NEILACOT_03814 [Neisseria lactamica ATCC 23970]
MYRPTPRRIHIVANVWIWKQTIHPISPKQPYQRQNPPTVANFARPKYDRIHWSRTLQKNRQIASDSQGVLISNHDTEFTRDIYSFAILKTVAVQRNIAAKGSSSRKKVGELLAIYA